MELGQALRRGTVVLDGGLATELEARGHDLSDPLWSARLLLDEPGAIRDVHRAFFGAGAMVATTATYQASFEGFARRGLDRDATAALLRRGVELARGVRDELAGDGRERWVAASVGPYGAMLADGSEYRGRYGRAIDELAAWHRPRLEILASARPDVLALETVPDAEEAEALVAALDGLDVPAWLSYTITGERTRAGQPLAEAFAVGAEASSVIAVGVNCCDPEDVTRAIAIARQVTGKPVVAYPNDGERWDALRRCWTGERHVDPEQAGEWVARGARLVGGCCRVTPGDIAALATTLRPGSGSPR